MKILTFALSFGIACFAPLVHSQTTPAPEPVRETPDKPAIELPGDHWRVVMSPYTIHYSYDANHRYVWSLGAERQLADRRLFGAAYFTNSFGQPSAYVYGGQRLIDFSVYPKLYVQWTAGVLYGYRGDYAHKVPLNHDGFSPGVVLSVGWQFTPTYSLQANVLGNSALMFQLGMDFP